MSEAGARSELSPAKAGWRVLVADEGEAVRAEIIAAIRAAEPAADIVEAATGRQAHELLVARRPEIAFITIQMPDMTGPEALAWASREGVQPFTILASSLTVPRWTDVAQALGAYEFLLKPIYADHVIGLLHAYRRANNPLRVLLVEHSKRARDAARDTLAHSRFATTIDESDDGREAVNALRDESYDIALINAALPGLDGLETACRARVAAPQTRLILTDGARNPHLARAARQFGIAAILRKPFTSTQMDYALHYAFGLRRPYLLNALIANATPQTHRAAGQ